MCGLVGIFGKITPREKTIFASMHHFDVCRGRDSSGILRVTNDNTPSILKGTHEPYYLSYEEESEDFLDEDGTVKGDLKLLLGHNRKTTSGATSKENAHPFHFGTLIGAHNGTLRDLSLKKFSNGELKVDTQKLYNAMAQAKEGILKEFPTISSVLGGAEGAAALTWWDTSTNTLQMFKNDERTLYYSTSKDNKTLLWASESWMISAAVMPYGESNFEEPRKVPNHKILSFYICEKTGNISLVKPVEVEMSTGFFQRKPYVANTQQNQQNVGNAGKTHNTTGSTNAVGTFHVNGKQLNQFRFNFLGKRGCVCCGEVIEWKDRDKTGFLEDEPERLLCPTCSEVNDISDYIGDFSLGYYSKTIH